MAITQQKLNSLAQPSPAIFQFLQQPTPKLWLDAAIKYQDILLIDHALCEKKAAASAVSLMHRYPECDALLKKMSRLAREELKHFELVLAIIRRRHMTYVNLPPSNYVKHLRQFVRHRQPEHLVDELIVGAIIEARSCERFSVLIPYLDEELAHFYASLLQSESRHFEHYLSLAQLYAEEDIAPRVKLLTTVESDYILSQDSVFRFHSGIVPS